MHGSRPTVPIVIHMTLVASEQFFTSRDPSPPLTVHRSSQVSKPPDYFTGARLIKQLEETLRVHVDRVEHRSVVDYICNTLLRECPR